MGLTFLAPLFLAGLIGLAIPVVVHLVHKEKPEGIPFPSLMFLQQIPVKSKRRQRIRHWVLFALRCLALALLAAAFSRPFLSGLSVAARVFAAVDGRVESIPSVRDGDGVSPGKAYAGTRDTWISDEDWERNRDQGSAETLRAGGKRRLPTYQP